MQICQSNIGKKKSIRLFRMTNQAIKIPHAFAVRHRDYTTSIPVQKVPVKRCTRMCTLPIYICNILAYVFYYTREFLEIRFRSVCHSNRKLIADTPSCFEARRDCRGFASSKASWRKKYIYIFIYLIKTFGADKNNKKKRCTAASSLFAERRCLLYLYISQFLLFFFLVITKYCCVKHC